MKIVTLYNHKGGVSKTSTTFNLAHLLSKKGRRVLIIDADSQCNITELCLANLIDNVDAESERTGKVIDLPGTTLLDALNQRIKGDVPFIDVKKVETVNVTNNFEILRGSVALNSIEDDLAEAHVQRVAYRTNLMRTYVAIGDFITRLSELKKFDYVFIDVGPSSGALTRACFLACDNFFIPIAADRFNVQAIGTLSKIIERWIVEHDQILEEYVKFGLPVRHGKPKFLGLISQFFKVYKGKPKAGYEMWVSRIPVEVNEKLKPVLEKYSTQERNIFLPNGLDLIATRISDFGQLAPLMQEVGKPVFDITREDTALITETGNQWGGGTWNQAAERMDGFRKCFEQIAEILEKN